MDIGINEMNWEEIRKRLHEIKLAGMDRGSILGWSSKKLVEDGASLPIHKTQKHKDILGRGGMVC